MTSSNNPSEKVQASLANMNQRQKITAVVFVVIIIIIIWQVIGLFRGRSSSTAQPAAIVATPPANMQASAPTAPGAPTSAPSQAPRMMTPQPATVPKPEMTEREAELLRMQQELQARYVAALNELQMLKVARDIAETNQAIMNAKLETISAEKKVVDLLAPPAPTPPPSPYPQQNMMGIQSITTTTTTQDVNYTVVSVSQIQGRWGAVMGGQGNLFSVHSGDVLPPDQSKVISIDKTGVVIEKDGARKKVSLVPII